MSHEAEGLDAMAVGDDDFSGEDFVLVDGVDEVEAKMTTPFWRRPMTRGRNPKGSRMATILSAAAKTME